MAETVDIMPKSPELEFEPEQILERSQNLFGFMNACIDSMDASVVQTIVGSLVKLGEMADELNRPEILDLLRDVQKVSNSLRSLLAEVNKLHESGTIAALLELGGIIQAVKDSSTSEVIIGGLAQVVDILAMLDRIKALGGDKLVMGMLEAMHEAVEENKGKEPEEMFSLLQQLNEDTGVKQGLGVLIAFMRKFILLLNPA